MPDHTFDLSKGPILTLVLSKPTDVQGFGGHVSTSRGSDGYGGHHPELYFTAGSLARPGTNLVFHLYEGHDPQANSLHHYRVDLGPKEDVHHAAVDIREGGIRLEWSRLSRNRTADRNQYGMTAWMPLARHVGFWRDDPPVVHARDNGVLSGRRGRGGQGFEGIRFRLHNGIEWREGEGSGDTNKTASASTGPGTGDTGG